MASSGDKKDVGYDNILASCSTIVKESKADARSLNFPIGYRFSPYDNELIIHFLLRRIFNLKLPSDYIKEFDVHKHDPEQLPVCELKDFMANKAYFFTSLSPECTHSNQRPTNGGFWEKSGGDEVIFHKNIIVGYKKLLVFYMAKTPLKATKTSWIMHEYRLNPGLIPRHALNHHSLKVKIESHVLCRIQNKSDK